VPEPKLETPPPPAAPPAPDAEPERTQADSDADARLYAAMYPDRVRRICAARGLPADIDFGPPEPEIVAALLRKAGISPRVTRYNGSGH
jgi:hypothetical protein